MKKWSDEQIQQCLQMYREGSSGQDICRALKVTKKSVSKYLRLHAVPSRGRGSPGPKNGAWRGGRRYDQDGYVLVYAPGHPHRTKQNLVREHRLVMEEHLGRFLEPDEVVDHRNRKTDDNRLENLQLYPSNAEHLRATLKGRRPKWTADGLRRMRVAALRQKIGRRILGAVQLQRFGVHRCKAQTCPLAGI